MKSSVVIFPHNKEGYNDVVTAFKTSNRTCVIRPTGTGKMYIVLQLIDDNADKRILFVTSYSPILTKLKEEMESCGVSAKHLTLALYASLNEEICSRGYDYIILDEFHRAGALVWGEFVKRILASNPNAKILGLSATPIRHLDEGRDMSDELFAGNVATQMSLAEAVGMGILKMPKYVCALYSLSAEFDRYEKRINKVQNLSKRKKALLLLEKARRALNRSTGLPEVFANNITATDGRYIVFCRSYDHMESMMFECRQWFQKVNPEIEVFAIRATYTASKNERTLSEFSMNKSNKIKLLFVVDMLNEGVHINNVDGCIMLRPTESANVFMQQLGRALAVNSANKTIVFDVVNNAIQLNTFNTFKHEAESIAQKYGTNVCLDDFKIHEDFQDFLEIISQIDELLRKLPWDKWLTVAEQYVASFGDLLVPERYITADGIALGRWVRNKRVAYEKKQLSAKQIEQLEQLGMVWDVYEADWKKMFGYAKAYYQKHGKLRPPVDLKTVDGRLLNLWVKHQRREYKRGNLSAECERLLNSIGMIWDVKEEAWEEMYDYAKEYYIQHGNLLIPPGYTIANGKKLDEWIFTQKKAYKKKKMSECRKARLEAIDIVWEAQDQWQNNYSYARKYFEKHGNLLVPVEYKTDDDRSLGSWVAQQRHCYIKGSLSKEQIEKLEEIKMIWDVPKYLWDEMFKHAEIYAQKHGDLLIPIEYETESGERVGKWLHGQRARYNKGLLSKDATERLESIGMTWNVLETKWQEMFKFVKEHVKATGSLTISKRCLAPNGKSLYNWIATQKRACANNTLSEEHQKELKKLGVI